MRAHLRFIGAAAIATFASAAIPALATADDYPSRTISLALLYRPEDTCRSTKRSR